MTMDQNLPRRILVVDDNVAIGEDFLKVLAICPTKSLQL